MRSGSVGVGRRTVREEQMPKYIMDTVSLRMKSIILHNEYANEAWVLGGEALGLIPSAHT